jgi:hypothetical protein
MTCSSLLILDIHYKLMAQLLERKSEERSQNLMRTGAREGRRCPVVAIFHQIGCPGETAAACGGLHRNSMGWRRLGKKAGACGARVVAGRTRRLRSVRRGTMAAAQGPGPASSCYGVGGWGWREVGDELRWGRLFLFSSRYWHTVMHSRAIAAHSTHRVGRR